MRGSYEQEWQNKLSGASVAPSEAVWENIASTMDTSHGKRNWVTILLIAATVTVAFAFPLTVGNSSFESRPIEDELVLNLQDNSIESTEFPAVASVEDEKEQNYTGASKVVDKSTLLYIEVTRKNIATIAETTTPAMSEVTTRGFSINDIAFKPELVIASIDNHYILPVYVKKDKSSVDGLILLGKLGSGSNSVSDGFVNAFSSSDALFASADTEGNLAMNQFNDARNEEGGTTYNLGFGIELPLGKKWRMVTGLGYMNQQAPGLSNVVNDNNGTYSPIGAYDQIGPGTVFLSTPYNYTASNNYLNLPLQVKYPFIDKKVKFRIGMGLGTDLMISHNISSAEFGDSSTQPGSTNYNQFGLSGLLNLDFRVSLNNSYALAFETGVRKGFTPVVKNGSNYPTSFNIGVVLFYLLGK